MTLKLRLLGAAAAVALSFGSVHAADMEVVDDAGWSGAYIGIIGGYGWGDVDFSADVYDTDTDVFRFTLEDWIDADGWLVGGQAGYDFDLGNSMVLGVAGDMSWSDMSGRVCVEGGIPGGLCDGTPDDSYASADINWLATVRARAGFTTGSLLVYANGGVAFADVESTVTFIDGGADPARSDSNTHVGWVVGAGAEMMVTQNVSIGAEYLYVDLGDEDYDFPGPGGGADIFANGDLVVNVVRASLNLRF